MPSQTDESDDEVSLHMLPKSPLLRRVVIVAAPRNFNNAATSSGVLRPSSENLVVRDDHRRRSLPYTRDPGRTVSAGQRVAIPNESTGPSADGAVNP
jgi:hypothetical protein